MVKAISNPFALLHISLSLLCMKNVDSLEKVLPKHSLCGIAAMYAVHHHECLPLMWMEDRCLGFLFECKTLTVLLRLRLVPPPPLCVCDRAPSVSGVFS